MSQTYASKEEIARRGETIYEQSIRSKVEDQHDGKIVAIDVDTGDFEIDETTLPAADRLKAKHPDAVLYVMRVGYDAVYGFGGFPARRTKQ